MALKTSLLYLENEIIYFWIWGRKIKDRNWGQKLRIKILYIVYYLTHTAWGVTLSPTSFFDKCEQMCNLLRIWSYLLKDPWGDFVSCAVSDIIQGDALFLVAKRTVIHRSKLLSFGCFHFWLRQNKSSLVCYINFTCH